MAFSDDLLELELKSDPAAFAAAMEKWRSLSAYQRGFIAQWWESRADTRVPLSIDMVQRLFLKALSPGRRS